MCGPRESCYGWTVYVDLNPHSQFRTCLRKLIDAACSEAPVCVAQLPTKVHMLQQELSQWCQGIHQWWNPY